MKPFDPTVDEAVKKSPTLGHKHKSLENLKAYESPSEDNEQDTAKEEVGLPIPTHISMRNPSPDRRMKDPEPKMRTKTENHPLGPQGEETKHQENELEGIRNEMKKIVVEIRNDNVNNEILMKHKQNCGCNSCFWSEASKSGKMTSKKAMDLVMEFTKNRMETKAMQDESHTTDCMCVIHLKKSLKDKEKLILSIIEGQRETQATNKKKEAQNNQDVP